MEARRLLIAENNEDLRLALARELQAFHYVRCCGTGTEALRILRQEQPELLVLGMSLPEIDSLTVLETIAAENIRPMVLAMTTYRSEYLEYAAHRLGIAYILLKPCQLDTIVRRVLDMKQYLRTLPAKPTPEQLLEEHLRPLGIRPHIDGYSMVVLSTVRMSDDPDRLMSKEVYRDVAKALGTTYSVVEKTVRRLIQSAYDPEAWQELFPDFAGPPTAKVFLRRMARLLRRDLE